MAAPAANPTESDPVSQGQAALQRGAWSEARACFEQAVADCPSPQAYEGLGWASRWLEDMSAVFPAWEEAYRLYQERHDRLGAGRVALWLAFDYRSVRGDQAVASGWMERSSHLLEGLDPAPEHGWLKWHRGYLALAQRDVALAKRMGAETARLGARWGDCDVEMLGRSLEGYTLVLRGDVAEGLRRLDEGAVAATSGEMRNPSAMAIACCLLVHGCERVRDFERAAQWCDMTAKVCQRWANRHMFAYCCTQYAGVLMWRGRGAKRRMSSQGWRATWPLWAGGATLAEALVRLAELHRRQGRLDEAEALLIKAEAHPSALYGQAALALARGDTSAAVELCERLLRRTPDSDRADRFPAYELLLRARLACGDQSGAADALDDVRSIARDIPPMLLGPRSPGRTACWLTRKTTASRREPGLRMPWTCSSAAARAGSQLRFGSIWPRRCTRWAETRLRRNWHAAPTRDSRSSAPSQT